MSGNASQEISVLCATFLFGVTTFQCTFYYASYPNVRNIFYFLLTFWCIFRPIKDVKPLKYLVSDPS